MSLKGLRKPLLIGVGGTAVICALLAALVGMMRPSGDYEPAYVITAGQYDSVRVGDDVRVLWSFGEPMLNVPGEDSHTADPGGIEDIVTGRPGWVDATNPAAVYRGEDEGEYYRFEVEDDIIVSKNLGITAPYESPYEK